MSGRGPAGRRGGWVPWGSQARVVGGGMGGREGVWNGLERGGAGGWRGGVRRSGGEAVRGPESQEERARGEWRRSGGEGCWCVVRGPGVGGEGGAVVGSRAEQAEGWGAEGRGDYGRGVVGGAVGERVWWRGGGGGRGPSGGRDGGLGGSM
uniref:Uncharacterized protein n=1 Tax=Knipowitschia caucasica TaxID=637954 RepID=A0AAV2MHM1_KNICA